MGILRNIVAIENKEEKPHYDEARFRAFVEHSSDIIVMINLESIITYINPAVEKVLGYQPAERIGAGGLELVHPDDVNFLVESFGVLTSNPDAPPITGKMRLLHKNGNYRIFDGVGSGFVVDGVVEAVIVNYRDITERQQIENDLRLSEQSFRSSLDDSPLGIRISNIDGETIYANRAILDIYGYDSMEELKKTPLHARYTPETYAAWQTRMKKRHAGEFIPSEYEISISRKNGEIRRLHVFRKSIFWNGQKQFQVIYNDITLHRQAEEKISQSEEKYRSIIEQMEEGYFEVDLAGNFTFANDALVKMLGYSRDEQMDMNYRQYMDKQQVQKVRRLFYRVYKTGKPVNSAFEEIIKKDGTKSSVEISISLIKNSASQPVGFRGISRDITERKRAEEALRASQELYTQLVNTIPDLVIRTELSGKIIFINNYAMQKGGYSWEEIEGSNVLDFISEEEQVHAVENLIRIIVEGKQGPFECHVINKNGGKIPFEISSGVINSEDGLPCGLVHVCRDIRLRKKDEQEKENLRESLNQSQKMESVGRLAGGVAHDFNNMLGVILGHAELAVEKSTADKRLQGHLQEIRKAAERSANLTRQLLAFARKQTVAPRVINLNDAVSAMMEMLQRLIGENVKLTWLPGKDVWPVKMDPSQIDQILANLCANARDAIAGVGKVSIESGNITLEQAVGNRHTNFLPGDYVFLLISDDGCGMDKETINKLFEPFFTTKDLGEGTGLGLAIVYGIIKQNKGFINVSSEPGQGTAFYIFFPRYHGETELLRKEEVQNKLIGGQETILLVEDEPAILDLTRILLDQQGYLVLTAETPMEALKLARKHSGEIHLLVTDVIMPEMNGRELARAMLTSYPGMKCLFMSGYTADMIAHHGVLDEGVNFIQKPFSRNDLTAKVREVLHQR